MACFVDDDIFLSASNAFEERRNDKSKATKDDNLDSDDKEVEDLFKDSESDSADPQLESLKR